MTKETKSAKTDDKPKLKPVILPTSLHADLLIPEFTFEPHPGEYHIIEVDPGGNEIPGTDTSVGANTYRRTFADNPKFKLKKKAK